MAKDLQKLTLLGEAVSQFKVDSEHIASVEKQVELDLRRERAEKAKEVSELKLKLEAMEKALKKTEEDAQQWRNQALTSLKTKSFPKVSSKQAEDMFFTPFNLSSPKSFEELKMMLGETDDELKRMIEAAHAKCRVADSWSELSDTDDGNKPEDRVKLVDTLVDVSDVSDTDDEAVAGGGGGGGGGRKKKEGESIYDYSLSAKLSEYVLVIQKEVSELEEVRKSIAQASGKLELTRQSFNESEAAREQQSEIFSHIAEACDSFQQLIKELNKQQDLNPSAFKQSTPQVRDPLHPKTPLSLSYCIHV
jgi:hypothetical protein